MDDREEQGPRKESKSKEKGPISVQTDHECFHFPGGFHQLEESLQKNRQPKNGSSSSGHYVAERENPNRQQEDEIFDRFGYEIKKMYDRMVERIRPVDESGSLAVENSPMVRPSFLMVVDSELPQLDFSLVTFDRNRVEKTREDLTRSETGKEWEQWLGHLRRGASFPSTFSGGDDPGPLLILLKEWTIRQREWVEKEWEFWFRRRPSVMDQIMNDLCRSLIRPMIRVLKSLEEKLKKQHRFLRQQSSDHLHQWDLEQWNSIPWKSEKKSLSSPQDFGLWLRKQLIQAKQDQGHSTPRDRLQQWYNERERQIVLMNQHLSQEERRWLEDARAQFRSEWNEKLNEFLAVFREQIQVLHQDYQLTQDRDQTFFVREFQNRLEQLTFCHPFYGEWAVESRRLSSALRSWMVMKEIKREEQEIHRVFQEWNSLIME